MSNTNKVIFAYGLTYLAMGLAVNQLTVPAAAAFLASAFIARPEKMRPTALIIPVIMVISELVLVFSCRDSAVMINDETFLGNVALCLCHFTIACKITRMKNSSRIRIVMGNGIIYLCFALTMLIMDLVLKRLIPSGGILAGFWVVALIMGINIMASLIILLASQVSVVRKTAVSRQY